MRINEYSVQAKRDVLNSVALSYTSAIYNMSNTVEDKKRS